MIETKNAGVYECKIIAQESRQNSEPCQPEDNQRTCFSVARADHSEGMGIPLDYARIMVAREPASVVAVGRPRFVPRKNTR